MSVRVQPLPGDAGLSLSGSVDYASAAACQAEGLAILAALPVGGAGSWTCDLSHLTTGSSVTAAVLMSWQRAAGRRQQRLILRDIPARLDAILQASNLLPVFTQPTSHDERR